MGETNPIEYITKDICQISPHVKLKHQVKLGRKDQNGNRIDTFYKYDFTSSNYTKTMDLSSLIITDSAYLVIEYKEGDNKESIFLSYPHLFTMKRIIGNAVKWFHSAKFDGMFYEKKDELFFNSKFKGLREETDYTIESKTLAFKPALVERKEIFEEGVIMVINGEFLTSITYYELETLYYTIANFDLYGNSLLLLNLAYSNDLEACISNNSLTSNRAGKSKIPNVPEFSRKKKKIVKPES